MFCTFKTKKKLTSSKQPRS